MTKLQIILCLVLLAFVSCGGSSKPSAPVGPGTEGDVAATSDDRPLPVDSRIQAGVLDNGLTYYVLEHDKPAERAQLWLAVNAGSVQEDDDQRGLAHFVEHMAFNGTAQFEKMAIVDYLESIGMKFGPDVNAYTSFDQTVYMLQVPTDDASIVDTGLDILHEWAGAVAFDPEEVDKERGVVTEEWRLGRGAGMRIADKQYPILFAGSKYAERLPIGKPEILKNAPRDTLVRFYQDWYRPDLMAVVAVGDFDGDEMVAKIKKEFSDLEVPENPRERVVEEVPLGSGPMVSIETDPEMTQTSVAIQNRLPHRPESSANDYRRIITDGLYHSMLGARLQEIARAPDSPFMFAASSTSSMVRSMDAFMRFAMAKQDSVARALEVLAEEVERVERHGFTASEFERAKKDMLRSYKQSVIERDKRDGRRYAAEILRHFFEGEMMPGIEAELALVERFLPTITLDELNKLAGEWGGSDSRVVLISGPEGLVAPDESEVLAMLESIDQKEIVAYSDEVSKEPLLATAPTPGKVESEKKIDAIGVTEWKLSNGATVVIKPTDFKNDEIRFQAFSPGGHSQVEDAQFFSARAASSIVNQSGVGVHDTVQLRKLLAGKVANASAFIGELEEGMNGSASPEDLKTFFELIHLRFKSPRVDKEAFETWKANELEWVRNRSRSPERSFFDDMTAFLSQNHLRRRPTTAETLAKVQHEQAIQIFKDRFANAGDFTFVFVGNIDLETFKPMVETYVASLPGTERGEKWKDVGVRPPKGVKKTETRKGIEPKSYVYLTFHGPQKWSKEEDNNMKALREVLRIRLREVLREDMGGVYGAMSFGSLQRRPRQEYNFTVFFGCDPDNVETLKTAVFDTIKSIQEKGIGDDYIEKVVKGRVRQRELDLKENGFWARELADAYRYGEEPAKILDDSMIEKVSSKQVQTAAKKYLRDKQYVLGVLRPEKVEAKAAK